MIGRSKRRRALMERRARMRLVSEASEPKKEVDPYSTKTSLELRAPRANEEWVDLIHHDPLVTLDVELLRSALRFAFESGDAGGLLGKAVDEAPITPSRWEPDVFAAGLFMPELLSSVFVIEIGKKRYEPSQRHLTKLLSHPPDDTRDVELRQGVLRELASNETLSDSLKKIYVALRELRGLLDERPMTPGETIRRKVEVLSSIKTVLDEADEGLASATSALSRLHRFAKAVREREVYTRLAQLLDFDENMVLVEVRVVLGSNGRIRDFQLVKAKENRENPLVWSPWRRFWSRFFSWLRGYRYEENEVLLKVVDEVFSDLEDVVLPCFDLIGDVELYLASLGFKDRVEKEGLEVCLPSFDEGGSSFELTRLFNPLLLLQGTTPTPCDIRTHQRDALLLITGPNSGGKTRMLQAVALTQLLGQNGLFVPAREARLTSAPTMFVSLVEGAPADQKEGRLGSELLRVRKLFEQLEPGSVVILDELCSGTNPSEGIAIFEMVVSLLPRLRPQVLVTTHFLDAARKLEQERPIERLEFLQVELDEDDNPTYQFIGGVAPTSLAHNVAARLGVTREELEGLVEQRERGAAPEESSETGLKRRSG